MSKPASQRIDMTMLGPFACIRTERLLADALAGDEDAKRKLRLLKLPHALCVPYRDRAICELAALIGEQAPGIKPQTLAKIIAAALDSRYADPCFLRFSADERKEISAHAAEVVFWMDGSKATLGYREIGQIVLRGE
jgi:hypothetical protein